MDESTTDPIGRTLEKRRHSLGKSLIDAEEATKIRAKKLEALEHGDYDHLPSPAYVKGYISAYAKYLGLDPDPLIASYETEAGVSGLDTPRLPDQVVAPRAQAHSVPGRTAVAVVAVIVLVVALVWGVGRLISTPEDPPPIPVSPEPTATTEPEPSPAPGPGEADGDEPAQDDPAEPSDEGVAEGVEGPFSVRVAVAPDSASWMRVTIDGLVAYEGTMAGGYSEEWTAEESAVLRIGRAPAVTVYQNGTPVEIPPGDPPVLELPLAP